MPTSPCKKKKGRGMVVSIKKTLYIVVTIVSQYIVLCYVFYHHILANTHLNCVYTDVGVSSTESSQRRLAWLQWEEHH